MAEAEQHGASYIFNIGWATAAIIFILAFFAVSIYWFRWAELFDYSFLGLNLAEYVGAAALLIVIYLLFRQQFGREAKEGPAPPAPLLFMPLAAADDLFITAMVILLVAAIYWEFFRGGGKNPKNSASSGAGQAQAGNGAASGKAAESAAVSGEKSGGASAAAGAAIAGMSSHSSLFIMLLIGAVAGRILLQPVPSVEPVIPLAIAAALSLGIAEGVAVGVIGYAASNLFMLGGIWGMWTVWQAIGVGIPAAVAGAVKTGKPAAGQLVAYTFFATVVFEIVVNAGSALDFNPGYFISALPFSVAHIVSNVVIAFLISPLLGKAGN